jgi:hypothetical protein
MAAIGKSGRTVIYLNKDRRIQLDQVRVALQLDSLLDALYACVDRGISSVLERRIQTTVTEVITHE